MKKEKSSAFGPDFDYPETFCPVPSFPVPLASGQAYSSRLFPEYVYEVPEDESEKLSESTD